MKELLKLSRQALEAHLKGKEVEISEELKKKYSKKQACFITLTKHGRLRGCIGGIYPQQELWKEIVENSQNAGFRDPRFCPVKENELKKIKIEISLLSLPRQIYFKDPKELGHKIYKKGVIIQKGLNSATYLPQVWSDLPDTEEFLSSLCLKAGLRADAWKKEKINVFVYDVKTIKED